MALGTPVAAAVAYSASGGTTVSPAYPAGILATDEVLLFVGQKPTTTTGGTVSTPNNWTLRDELTAAGGYTAQGADTGNTNLRVYSWDTVTAGQTGNLSVTIGGNDVTWAFMVRVPTGGSVSYGTADGQRTTTPTSPMTVALTNGASATNFQAGDLAIWAMCIPTDVTTPNQFSAHSVTASGATFGTAAELNEPDSQTGNDIGGFSAYASVTSGSSTAAPSITVTLAGTLTNVRGPIVMVRIRETVQTLAPTKYDNTQTFFSPTVTSSVSLQPALYTNGQTFYSADITQSGAVQDLQPSLYTNNQTFYGPALAASYSLLPSKYDNAQTFYSPSVTTSYSLQPSLYTNSQAFFSPAVSASNTLAPALYTNDQVFYTPGVTQTGAPQTVAPDLYSNSQTFYSVTVDASYSLAAAKYDNAQTFFAPTIDQTGADQTLTPELYSNTQDFFAVTLAASNILAPQDYVDPGYVDPGYIGPNTGSTQQFYSPTLIALAVLRPELVANQSAVFAPTVNGSKTLTYAEENARAYGKARRRDYNPVESGENIDWALRMQIDEEDEIVLATVMAAAPILGANKWQQ